MPEPQSTAAGSAWRRGGWLLAAWFVCFLAALAATAFFVAGIARDMRWGEPRLQLDLARPSDWQNVPFRIWSGGRYTMNLTTVNHDPAHVGARLRADIEVRISDPDGRKVFQRRYTPEATSHKLPDNMHWTRLHEFTVDAGQAREWTLAATVYRGDPRFATGRSEILLRSERYDPGMGGLINYVMIVPAALFALIAFAIALRLASARRVAAPLVLSGLLLLGLAATAIG